jgi:hypothetical protein
MQTAIVTVSHDSDLGGDKPGDAAHELVPMEKPQTPHTAIVTDDVLMNNEEVRSDSGTESHERVIFR